MLKIFKANAISPIYEFVWKMRSYSPEAEMVMVVCMNRARQTVQDKSMKVSIVHEKGPRLKASEDVLINGSIKYADKNLKKFFAEEEKTGGR